MVKIPEPVHLISLTPRMQFLYLFYNLCSSSCFMHCLHIPRYYIHLFGLHQELHQSRNFPQAFIPTLHIGCCCLGPQLTTQVLTFSEDTVVVLKQEYFNSLCPVPHCGTHGTDWHNWKQFEELCLITFFKKLKFVHHVPSANKGITHIWIFVKRSAIFLVSSYKYGTHT